MLTAGTTLSTTGRVRNLAANASGFGGVSLTYQIESINTPDAAGYVDGELYAAPAPEDRTFDVAGLVAGTHTAAIHLIPASAPPPRVWMDPLGQRARLAWVPSIDPTTVAYNLYWDAGLSGASNTLLATLSDVAIAERAYALPDAGGTTGRISIFGHFPTEIPPVNLHLMFAVLGPAQYAFAVNGAATPLTTGAFSRGDTVSLPYGARVTFHDDPEDYATNSLWAIHIGPRAEYLSADLAPGTYRFATTALDAAGNESAPTPPRPVAVIAVPAPVSIVAATHTANELTVTWSDPAGIQGVRVYTNYNLHTGLFEDYVIEETPTFAIPAGVESFSITPASEGVLNYYLRPYFPNGIERTDLSLYAFSFPPTPADQGFNLSTPTGLTVAPTAGGNWLLQWDYRFTQNDDAAGFHVYRETTTDPFDFDAPPFVTVPISAHVASTTPGRRGPALRHYEAASPVPEVGTVRLAVRAYVGSVTTTNTDYVSVTPDATAPTSPGNLSGGAA